MTYEVRYDRITKDYSAVANGELLGFYATRYAADEAVAQHRIAEAKRNAPAALDASIAALLSADEVVIVLADRFLGRGADCIVALVAAIRTDGGATHGEVTITPNDDGGMVVNGAMFANAYKAAVRFCALVGGEDIEGAARRYLVDRAARKAVTV
jgi:hypothetical protein